MTSISDIKEIPVVEAEEVAVGRRLSEAEVVEEATGTIVVVVEVEVDIGVEVATNY